MAGGEVALGVPVRLAGLDLVRGQLVTVVHLHGAVDDAVGRDRLEVPDLQHHHLDLEGEDDVRLAELRGEALLLVLSPGERALRAVEERTPAPGERERKVKSRNKKLSSRSRGDKIC